MTKELAFGPWIIWNGGDCPLPDDARVQAQRGREDRHLAVENELIIAGNVHWSWSWGGLDDDIIAYRVAHEVVRETVHQEIAFRPDYGLTNAFHSGYRIKAAAIYDTIDGKPDTDKDGVIKWEM